MSTRRMYSGAGSHLGHCDSSPSPATSALELMERVTNDALHKGSAAANPNLNRAGLGQVRALRRDAAMKQLEPLRSELDAFGAKLDADHARLLSKGAPAPANEMERGSQQEIRDWFRDLSKEERIRALHRARTSNNAEVLAALWHAPSAFDLLDEKTRADVGETLARASNPTAYDNIVTGREQLQAARDALPLAEKRLHELVDLPDDKYNAAQREQAQRDRLNAARSDDAA